MYGGQCATYLCGSDMCRQFFTQCNIRQGLESSGAVSHGTAESRISSVRSNDTFTEFGVADHALKRFIHLFLAGSLFCGQSFQHGYIHGIQHVGIVIVHAEFGTVAVPSVTHVPFPYLVFGYFQAERITLASCPVNERFVQTGKDKPVVVCPRPVPESFQ